MRVDFYQLAAAPIERILPQIAERVLASGARLLVVEPDDARRAVFDRMLWSYAADSFLPHACAGAGDDAAQPVLLSPHVEAANGATMVALADGQWRNEALCFERALHFFDAERVEEARAAWRSLGGREGVERSYWRQGETGRWEKVA